MKFRKGDTLIEVLLAIAVFATVMMIGLSTMNNGMSRALASLQLTMARNAMDSQAEALRFANAAFISDYRADRADAISNRAAKLWDENLIQGTQTQASKLEDCAPTPNAFVISTNDMVYHQGKTGGLTDAVTYPRISYGSGADTNELVNIRTPYRAAEGIWVEKVKPDDANARYYDFHIRACWSAPGSNVNTTLGTIVRLYDPRS